MNFISPFPVPEEMKQYPNWVCFGAGGDLTNKEPHSPITGGLASSIDPNTWGSYQQACEYATRYGFYGIGFMLSQYDPYTIIDLDDPNGDPEISAAQMGIFNNFYSYAEISPSGKGLHIICKGNIPKGRRRSKIEVYSQARYMTMTGNVYRNVEINACQEELRKLYQGLSGNREQADIMDEQNFEVEDDETIWEKARAAANGQKFEDLWYGNWHEYYPHNVDPMDPTKGASEADYALIDILAYYTNCKAQIVRMFHSSALGQRAKAHRQDYLNYMLDRCFDNKLPPIDLSYFQSQLAEEVAKVNLEMENPHITKAKQKKSKKDKSKSLYDPPPGLLGEIAEYIYQQAPRPVREIALAGALGLMSGICGKAYNVSGTGLNQYYLLLAETGRGKEAMASGIGKIMNEVKKLTPPADDFLGPGEMASSQGLIRYMSDGNTSFVSVLGEFGLVLKQMTSPSAPAHLVGLRRILLDLYNKSGEGQSVRPSVYSDKAKNTKSIMAPAISLLGESTPSRFYEVLDETMISEGWLPRWVCIEYRGKRVKKNYAHKQQLPSSQLVEGVASICANALTLNSQNAVINVGFSECGNRRQAEYNDFCDDQINNTATPIRAELWNRAHLKSLKLAAIVAVGINPIHPVICRRCMDWAIDIINKDCINIVQRFDAGEIGGTATESTQLMKVLEVITEFVTVPYMKFPKSMQSLPRFGAYHSERVIPYSYLQRKCVGLRIFKEDRLGATNAIKKTIKTLVESDEIAPLDPPTKRRKFDSLSPCYIIKNKAILEDGYRKGFL